MPNAKWQWSSSPETIMSHHFRLARGVPPVVDVSPPFSMYNSPISVHYIPQRRASSADATRRKMSKSQRELNEFVNGRTPASLKLPLPLRSSLAELVKPKIIESRNYQPPMHRRRQKQENVLDNNNSNNTSSKSPTSKRRFDALDFKDAILSEIIASEVYSDSFIVDVIRKQREKFSGRISWQSLEKASEQIIRQLDVNVDKTPTSPRNGKRRDSKDSDSVTSSSASSGTPSTVSGSTSDTEDVSEDSELSSSSRSASDAS